MDHRTSTLNSVGQHCETNVETTGRSEAEDTKRVGWWVMTCTSYLLIFVHLSVVLTDGNTGTLTRRVKSSTTSKV